MIRKIQASFLVLVFISCVSFESDNVFESTDHIENSITTTSTTTSTISKNIDEFHTAGGIVTFTNDEIKNTFHQFFELKIDPLQIYQSLTNIHPCRHLLLKSLDLSLELSCKLP